ncbi:hypothetical protein SOVF_068350 [Spinacia oleracea]|nr:hypothetical protein SOVF_068350 [Spinacia oleracea]
MPSQIMVTEHDRTKNVGIASKIPRCIDRPNISSQTSRPISKFKSLAQYSLILPLAFPASHPSPVDLASRRRRWVSPVAGGPPARVYFLASSSPHRWFPGDLGVMDFRVGCRAPLHSSGVSDGVEPAPGVDLESLEVAKDCLTEVFKLHLLPESERPEPKLTCKSKKDFPQLLPTTGPRHEAVRSTTFSLTPYEHAELSRSVGGLDGYSQFIRAAPIRRMPLFGDAQV